MGTKTNLQRLNNICGQITAISGMLESEDDVMKVLIQMKAARSALNSVMTKYIHEHFWEYMKNCDNQEDSCKKFLDEIIQSK